MQCRRFLILGLMALWPTAALIAALEPQQGEPGIIRTPNDAREHGLESLRKILRQEGRPKPDDFALFSKNERRMHQLGKALFHDMQVGSDGVQSCASCHFHAGADNRAKNQINPNLTRIEDDRNGNTIGFFNAAADPDTNFEVRSPNQTLRRQHFPFVRDIGNGDNVAHAGDTILPAPGNSNDVTSSQGVRNERFLGIQRGNPIDITSPLNDPVFNDRGSRTRRVEPRNTPTVINAVFNFTNFWDGRANHFFNGLDPFGFQNLGARIFVSGAGDHDDDDDDDDDHEGGNRLRMERFGPNNASLGSQAAGPPLSDFEMSAAGRTFPHIGRKMLNLQPLAGQKVAWNDSLLGGLRHPSGTGLRVSYAQMIRAAFRNEYWDSNDLVFFSTPDNPTIVSRNSGSDPNRTFTHMEANFSLYFSIAVMAYEATLVSDATAFDRWMMGDGDYVAGFGEDELSGLNVFVDQGKCINCHGGPELTNASVRNAQRGQNVIEPMVMGDNQAAIYDNGFYNIGVTPTPEDIGRGGKDPWGRPLAFSRQLLFEALDIQNIPFPIIGAPIRNLEPLNGNSNKLGFFAEDPDDPRFFVVCEDRDGDGLCGENDRFILKRVAVDGSFKTPGLRNVLLTGPYFHNGSVATLAEVVEFYDRGGNFCRTNSPDLDPDIQVLGLSEREEADLVSFLIALTDPRVRSRSAPFDGPQIFVPDGQDALGNDIFIEIRETGSSGLPWHQHLKPFLNADPFSANPVSGECSPNFVRMGDVDSGPQLEGAGQ